jgi:uncharacterized protein
VIHVKTGKKLLDDLIAELTVGLDGVYGDRLKGLYLYGSYARGEEDRESDLDILVVLEQFDHYAAEVNRTGELASELSLKYGMTISPVFVRETEWLDGDTPFFIQRSCGGNPVTLIIWYLRSEVSEVCKNARTNKAKTPNPSPPPSVHIHR